MLFFGTLTASLIFKFHNFCVDLNYFQVENSWMYCLLSTKHCFLHTKPHVNTSQDFFGIYVNVTIFQGNTLKLKEADHLLLKSAFAKIILFLIIKYQL
jgi:hypothetical protein